MKNYRAYILILTLPLFIVTCKKDVLFKPVDYPGFIITAINEINAEGITVTAEITSLGNDSIIDYGFVWSTSEEPDLNDFRKSLTHPPKMGTFKEKISNCIDWGVIYYIRPYIQSTRYLVYGVKESFVGMGSIPFQIIDFSPKSGKIGSEVTITCSNLNQNAEVYFGNIKAEKKSSNSENIVATVPYLSGDNHISVQQNGVKLVFPLPFQVIFPWSKILIPEECPSLLYPAAFSLEGKGYILSGYSTNTQSYSNEVWEFNPSDNSWTRKSDFPGQGRIRAISFIIDNDIYICLGDQGYGFDPFSDLWKYETLTDTWSQKANFPLDKYGLPVCFTNSGKAYVGLGLVNYNDGGGNISSKFWSYDPIKNEWNQIADYPYFNYSATAFTIGNSSYVGLGMISGFYEYNPSENSWSHAFEYPGNGRDIVCSYAYNDKAYLGFGLNDNHICNDQWEYNSVSNTWTPLISFPYAIKMSFSFSINNKGYYYDENHMCLWEFDPEKN
jgi:N-acetylneuraminic acid mutarotase